MVRFVIKILFNGNHEIFLMIFSLKVDEMLIKSLIIEDKFDLSGIIILCKNAIRHRLCFIKIYYLSQ
jgi:hypothetical protein